MLEQDIIKYSDKLAKFISTKNFTPITPRTPYYHMGATIIDSILQAGLNYQYVVYPRVHKLLQDFPYYIKTCDFIILMETFSLIKLINWQNEKKPLLIEKIAWFFFEQKIEDEDTLADWLNSDENIKLLSKFKGIGFKTIDYLKMLSGNQAIAVDRHLFKFLNDAGIMVQTYQEANQIYSKTAEILELSKYELDRKIWLYMSKSNVNILPS
jgi:hypothetical protein